MFLFLLFIAFLILCFGGPKEYENGIPTIYSPNNCRTGGSILGASPCADSARKIS